MNDEIKGLVAELTDDANELDVQAQHLVVTREFVARIRQAASLLTLSDEARVRAESMLRDAVDGAQPLWSGDYQSALDRAQASEALVRELVEGLRPFGALWDRLSEDDRVRRAWTFETRVSIDAIRKAQALILRAEALVGRAEKLDHGASGSES